MSDRTFNLNLPEQDVNTILSALNEIPTKFGMPVVTKIINQANAQVKPVDVDSVIEPETL